MNFCKQCGEKVTQSIPENDNRLRYVCISCETIHYENPNIVAGVLPLIVDDDGIEKVLMCRRAIEPRYGLWTLPAGFMENGESVEEAALRESHEEANLKPGQLSLYMVMSLPYISQVYMIFVGWAGKDFSPGIESLETRLFDESEIPWNEIAFPVITKTLQCYFADRNSSVDNNKQNFPLHNLCISSTETINQSPKTSRIYHTIHGRNSRRN